MLILKFLIDNILYPVRKLFPIIVIEISWPSIFNRILGKFSCSARHAFPPFSCRRCVPPFWCKRSVSSFCESKLYFHLVAKEVHFHLWMVKGVFPPLAIDYTKLEMQFWPFGGGKNTFFNKRWSHIRSFESWNALLLSKGGNASFPHLRWKSRFAAKLGMHSWPSKGALVLLTTKCSSRNASMRSHLWRPKE